MSKVTELAAGQITKAESIRVELIRDHESPAVIIKWPTKPTVCTPAAYHAFVAAATRILTKRRAGAGRHAGRAGEL